MAYRTYTTDALVVGSGEHLSSDRTIFLFTRDVGLVYARAVSVRKEVSKLRYGLQDFSTVRCSLVRGKQGWRIVGAEQSNNMYFNAPDRASRAALLRIIRLIRRFVRGEESHVKLYDTLMDGLQILMTCKEDDRERIEHILTLRILFVLGYVAPHAYYRDLLELETLKETNDIFSHNPSRDKAVQTAINDALLVSQL